jgi:hypothetical protein
MTASGWAFFPTRRNERGEPKLPKLETLSAFTKLTPAQNNDHDWRGAAGIAVALGKPSGGLGCIDVDHPGLADYLRDMLLGLPAAPLAATTPTGLHIFTTGPETLPQDLAARYPGVPARRFCLVQLLSTGCYAVIPPTEGYRWINKGSSPGLGSPAEIWRRLALAYGIPHERAKDFHFLPRDRSSSPRLSTREIREAMR